MHRVGIKAPTDKVYNARTEEKGLAGWWSRFNDRGFNDMKVVELVPGQRVKWQCVDGAKEWISTELTFDLRPQEEFTILLFAQRGWKEPVEFMHYCSTKWATYMLSLKSLCETGSGTPYPDDISIDA